VFLGRSNQPASGGGEVESLVPSTFTLIQNYPNPFNPSTTIAFEVYADDALSPINARLDIFNVLGERVATPFNAQVSSGHYTIEWDSSQRGRQVASGVYFYRLQIGSETMTKKMVLLK